MSKRKSEASKILTKAAGIIEKRGWCRNNLENPQGAVCALGAINLALGGSNESGDASPRARIVADTLEAYLEAKCRSVDGFYQISVEDWNDSQQNRKNTVVKVLRNAAKWDNK